ncbi:hypothetical protein ACOME3_002898 [Neoechinorhynchus agilis]
MGPPEYIPYAVCCNNGCGQPCLSVQYIPKDPPQPTISAPQPLVLPCNTGCNNGCGQCCPPCYPPVCCRRCQCSVQPVRTC